MSTPPAPGNATPRTLRARLGWIVRPEFWGSLFAHAGLLLWIGWPTSRSAEAPTPLLDVYVVDLVSSETMGEVAPGMAPANPVPAPAIIAPPQRAQAKGRSPLQVEDLAPLPLAEPASPLALPERDAVALAGAIDGPADPVADLSQQAAAAPAESGVEEGIQLRLLAHLRRHQFYPRAARRAGIEGSLQLAVRIDGDGRVLQVTITASSGHTVLDHAALALVARAEPFPSPRALAGLEQVDIALPLDYRLDMAALASGSP